MATDPKLAMILDNSDTPTSATSTYLKKSIRPMIGSIKPPLRSRSLSDKPNGGSLSNMQSTCATHSERIDALTDDLGDVVEEHRSAIGDIMEAIGRLMTSSQHTADKVGRMDVTLGAYMSHTDRRFDELKTEWGRLCVLKHEGISKDLERLQHRDAVVEQDLRKMSEDSKVFYIQQLEKDLESAKSSQKKTVEKAQDNNLYWQRYRVTIIVSLCTLVIGSALTYLARSLPQVLKIESTPAHSHPPVK